ncbi:MAG: magnesium transporter, partial [Lachnospiraceae bacterium]|nr:magnesium transporter [Lachnospiraceae bacterium]
MENIVIPTEEEILTLFEAKKYAKIRELFIEMNPADIAALLNDFPKDKSPVVFRLLPKELAADT